MKFSTLRRLKRAAVIQARGRGNGLAEAEKFTRLPCQLGKSWYVLLLAGVMALALLAALDWSAGAQTAEPTPQPSPEAPAIPLVHTVQEGENLTFIAESYGVTVDELLAVNGLSADAILQVGQTLFIPGGEGDAVTTVYTIQVGDSLAEIAAAFNTTPGAILAANRLLNAEYQWTAGQTVAVVSRTGSAQPQPVTGTLHVVALGESLRMVAARYSVSPYALAAANDLPYPTYLFPGQRLRIPSERPYRFLPGEWVEVRLQPLPVTQGDTVSIYVENLLDGRPSGQFAGQSLRFFPYQDGYAALVGIDAFTEPGEYTLQLEGSGNRPWQPFRQTVPIHSADYGIQFINVGPELEPLLEPQVRQEEDAFLATIYTQFSETQRWEDIFQAPVTNTIVTARYGDGRSYNAGPVEIFHTGVDFAGGIGTPILTPAAGEVMFSDWLELRGLSIIIDHGLGVMTAYFHLSETFVSVGDQVEPGQVVGAGGSTGLSTGPHLHWDLRIMNVAVDGMRWLERPFP